MSWVLTLLCLSWVASFTSQSLIDISDTFLIGTALYTAFKKYEWKKYFTGYKPALLWPIWISIILFGLVINADLRSEQVWRDFLEFRWILTFMSWIYLLTNLKNRKGAINIIAIITLILNVAALVVWLKDTEARAGGLLYTAMAFAHNIGPVLCFFGIQTLARWRELIKKDKIIYLAVTLTSGFLTVVTYTRGIWIGCIAGLVATTFFWNKKIFAMVLGALITVFIIGVSTSKRFSDRVFTRTSNETESNQERTALWRGNWEMVKEHPVIGVGLGTNKSHLRRFYDQFGYPQGQRESHAHNQYLQYWAGTGTLGLLCYLVFLFFILKYSYEGFKGTKDNELKYLQLGLLAALICFLVGSLTESNFNIAKNRFFFLILAGMAIAWAKPLKKN